MPTASFGSGELSTEFDGGFHVGGVRFFGRVEQTEIPVSSRNSDLSNPSVALGMLRDSLEAAHVRVLQPHVPKILCARCLPEIDPPVIGAQAIDVVDVVWRPFASDHEPYESVGCNRRVVHYKAKMSVLVGAPCTLSCITAVPPRSNVRSSLPPKIAGFCVVVEDRPHELSREIVAWLCAAWYRFVSHPIVSFRSAWSGLVESVVSALPVRPSWFSPSVLASGECRA